MCLVALTFALLCLWFACTALAAGMYGWTLGAEAAALVSASAARQERIASQRTLNVTRAVARLAAADRELAAVDAAMARESAARSLASLDLTMARLAARDMPVTIMDKPSQPVRVKVRVPSIYNASMLSRSRPIHYAC